MNTKNDDAGEVIRIVGPEAGGLDFSHTDGGLELAPGVRTAVVFRADREHPETTDGRGWTYHHHPSLACWKGRLYVGWNSCERFEDTWPSRELFSTSLDGEHWSPLAELFPQGISTPLRMYFFHAPNGRMLAIAGLRVSHDRTPERSKGPLVVREVSAEHALGPVFTLRPPEQTVENQPPIFDSAADAGFIESCRQLLADRLFLEQQDYGNLLSPDERIKWHDPNLWQGDEQSRQDAEGWGKALCFFERQDGAMVGVSKNRWVTLSHDAGHTWSQPVRPSTLISGMGKVWGQRTPQGRYILIYNPHPKMRHPLAIVTSDDGITFGQMRSLHRELPARRYSSDGNTAPRISYVRGLSQWSSDGSCEDNGVWLTYSVNNEEIRVSYLPQEERSPAVPDK